MVADSTAPAPADASAFSHCTTTMCIAVSEKEDPFGLLFSSRGELRQRNQKRCFFRMYMSSAVQSETFRVL